MVGRSRTNRPQQYIRTLKETTIEVIRLRISKIVKLIVKRVEAKPKILVEKCYGPYKQDSTSTKKRLVLGQDQYAGCEANKTSRTIGRGVAESRNHIYTECTHVLMY